MALRLLILLLLAGCGYKGPVSRIDPDAPGMDRDALKAARKAEAEGVVRGLTPTAEQRPVRVDDIPIRAEDRTDDPFNLPPE